MECSTTYALGFGAGYPTHGSHDHSADKIATLVATGGNISHRRKSLTIPGISCTPYRLLWQRICCKPWGRPRPVVVPRAIAVVVPRAIAVVVPRAIAVVVPRAIAVVVPGGGKKGRHLTTGRSSAMAFHVQSL